MKGTSKDSLLSVFGLARRGNVLQIGQDIVKSSLARGESLLVIFVREPESSFYRSLQKRRLTEKCQVVVLSGITGDELSAAIGSVNVKVVALPLRSGFARSISQLLAEGGEINE